MVQLTLLSLACMLSWITLSRGQNDLPALFSEECCTKKMVGEVGYTQVPGNTDGFDCTEQCVYEEDGKPGSRTCFKSGGPAPLPVKCTESFIGSAYVSFARNSGNITFKTEIGTYSCTVGTATIQGENVECSKQVDQEAGSTPGSEEAAFFFSKSPDDEFEWMCFHTIDIGIHCDFINEIWICHFVPPYVGEAATLFVECAQNITGNNLTKQIHNCQALCNSMPEEECMFWTLSFKSDATNPIEHTHEHRFHQGYSECGTRNYDPIVLLNNINPDQFTGKRGEQNFSRGSVYVFDKTQSSLPRDCQAKCEEQNKNPNLPPCTTWTWQRQPDGYGSVCAINVYKPTRKIPIPKFAPPQLVSGCIPNKDVTCPTKPSC